MATKVFQKAILINFLLIISMLTGCGGGGSSDSSSQSQSGVRISISNNQLEPISVLELTADNLDNQGQLIVEFKNEEEQYSFKVPVIDVVQNKVYIMVPPYFSNSGEYKSGVVTIQLIQQKNTNTVYSNKIEGVKIGEFNTNNNLKAGIVTLDFLNGMVLYSQRLKNDIKGTLLDTPEIISRIDELLTKYQLLAQLIKELIDNPDKTFIIGYYKGNPIQIDRTVLMQTDLIILKMFQNISISIGINQNQFKYLKSNNIIDCIQSSYGNGECSYNTALAIANSAPYAFEKAYRLITGVSTITMGVMLLSGAPATALAIPTAALIYCDLVGGAGLISIGATLKQTTPEALKYVQTGIVRIENTLKTITSNLITTLYPKLEKPLTIYDIIQAAIDLKNLFINKISSGNGGGSNTINSYTGTFSGTTIETSLFATIKYDIVASVTINITGGNGSMIDPYRGDAVMEGVIFATCTPNVAWFQCSSGQENFSLSGPVKGSSFKVEADFYDEDKFVVARFMDGSFSGNELVGTLIFDEICNYACAEPIVKNIRLIKTR